MAGEATGTTAKTRGGPARRALDWALVGGNRFVVVAVLEVAFFAALYLLIATGVAAVGDRSTTATLLASGMLGGMLSLITITLTINQLILSRLFGSIEALRGRVEASAAYRDAVEDRLEGPSGPNDVAEFLAAIAGAVERTTAEMDVPVGAAGMDEEEFRTFRRRIRGYADSIGDVADRADDPGRLLTGVMGPEYAQNIAATQAVMREYREDLPDAGREDLEALLDLLQQLAIARQFLKTVVIQQQLARLSRLVAGSGFLSVIVIVLIALVYRTDAPATIPPEYLPVVVTGGLTVGLLPLSFVIAYIVRVSTVARYSVSVGPFVPPENWE